MPNRIPALHRRIKQLHKEELLSGKILSFTRIHHPPKGFGMDPYDIAIIERNDGTKICAQLTTSDIPLSIGAEVIPKLRHIRTMENGLRINDIKYELASVISEPKLHIQHYVLALTGPSGVGKTTVTRALLKLLSVYTEQVPVYTTRTKKKGDIEPYIHVSEEVFQRMLKTKEIVAHTSMPSKSEVRMYGYRKEDIENVWKKHKLPIIVTDIHLLKGLSEYLGRRAILSCGLLPPGESRRHMLSSLLHRMRSRGRETEEQMTERLKTAEFDLDAFSAHPHLFDHMVVNDELDNCLQRIQKIVLT